MRTFTVTIDEEKKKKLEEQQQYILKKLKDTDNQEKMVLVGYTIMLLYFCILIMRYALAFYGIQPKVLTNNPMLLILCSSLPIFLWLYMTKFDFFNYYRRKKFLAYFVMLNMLVTLLQPIYSLTWKYAVRYILKIPLSRTITINMVLGLARMVLAAALALATAIIVIQVQPYIFTPSATEELLYIKWKYLFDTRENHKYAYDLRFIKDLETGKDLLIKEIDRYTHMYITGASGTGKTSSCYNNIILQDLITKITNRNKRYKELAKMVLSGKAYFKKPFKIFVESYIEPKEEYKAEYDNIYKKYPDCGITVQAPNGSLNDGIIKMAAARKLTVNLIDPTRDKPKYKSEKLIGLNPFSIPLPEEGDPVLTDEVTVLILEKSKIFAQVLAALNELSGKVDTYFQAVNRSVTTTIATIHMLDCYLRGKQADIFMIQRSINKYSDLKEPIERIEEKLGFTVTVDEIGSKRGTIVSQKKEDIKDNTTKGIQSQIMKENAERESPFYLPIYTAKQELLGEGQSDMYSQSRGLRNLINEFLSDPRIRKVFNTSDVLDFDAILSRNEITLINTGMSISPESSTALGLFFMLNLKAAVSRRPEENRSAHFYHIDEGPQYLHPELEAMWALFRQYRCAITFDAQSLAQMKKKPDTAFLEEVILSAGIHVLFGRCTTAEIDIYTKLAGTRREDVSQISKNWNSILSENPNISMSERKTPTDVNILTGRAARKRDFQEVTVFSQDEGRVLDAILGKVWFLDKKKAFRSVKTYEVDWEKLYLNSIKKNNNMQVNRNIASPSTSSTEAKTEYPETQEIQKSLSGSTADSHFVSLDRTEDAQDDDELLILPKQQSVSSLTKKQFEKLKEASQIAVESGQIVDRPDFAEFDDFFNN